MVTDEQACLDAAYDAFTNSSLPPTFKVFSFDTETSECVWYPRIIPNELRAPEEQPKYWMRIDLHMHLSALTLCLTDQDARYLLMQVIYENDTCPLGVALDVATGFCTSNITHRPYDFEAGSLKNGTEYRLSRVQTADSINYLCDNEQARK
ncbi:hypothetical protein AAVH_43436, partial [Aphelenchoides avenae]